VASTSAFVIGDETNTAAFAELRATPIKNLEVGTSQPLRPFRHLRQLVHAGGQLQVAAVQQFGCAAPSPAASARRTRPRSAMRVRSSRSTAIDDPILCQSVNGVSYQLAGTQGPSGVGGATGNPKNRAQFALTWARGPLDITANVNYTSSFSTLDPSVGALDCASTAGDVGGRNYFAGNVQPDAYCHVASFTVTNLTALYKLSPNLTLKGTVQNLFDRAPPIDVGTYGNATAQTSYNASLHQAGAIGRAFSLGLAYTF
jgi:hypothetical protein